MVGLIFIILEQYLFTKSSNIWFQISVLKVLKYK